MSHSPDEKQDRDLKNPRSEFRRQLKHLDSLINHGGSLSGNERNCAFLNLGRERRFATISHISGLDFKDDGRSYCLTDWDNDGDVDLWSMNRTGPRVRFLQNQQSTGHHFLRIKLVGTTSNRDAIGARVELHLEEQQGRPQKRMKTLRAGQGFLSQSSKWMHFGLGHCETITDVKVLWPNEVQESFGAVPIDGAFELTQGSAEAKRVSFPAAPGLVPMDAFHLPKMEQAQVLLTSRLPVPRLPWVNQQKERKHIGSHDGLTLVNLWATWCVPCRKELHDLVKAAPLLKREGISVIALSVDKQTAKSDDTESERTAIHLMNKLDAPFPMGFATQQLLDRLQFLDDFLFSQKRNLSIPVSFLIDQDGCLAAIFRGPIDTQSLTTAAAKTRLTGKARYDAALPFDGIWIRPNATTTPLRLVVDLVSKGENRDAADYVLEHENDLIGQRGFVALVGQLAGKLARQNDVTTAIRLDRSALKQDPENIAIMNNLAWRLATHPNKEKRNAKEAVMIAELAAKKTNYATLPVLDTLVAALLEDGKKQRAISVLEICIRLAEAKSDTRLVKGFRSRLMELRKK